MKAEVRKASKIALPVTLVAFLTTLALTEISVAATVEEIRRFAEQGSSFAQNLLGVEYELGGQVPQDYVEAVKWFRRAADQGDPCGQSSLGFMYFQGHGVPRDFVQAHKWLNLAGSRCTEMEKTEPNLAIKSRDFIAKRMTSEQVAEAQKLARDFKPSSEFLKSIDPAELQRLTDMARDAARKLCAEGNPQSCAISNYQDKR